MTQCVQCGREFSPSTDDTQRDRCRVCGSGIDFDRAAESMLHCVSGLFRVDFESAKNWVSGEAQGVVFVWDANSLDQIGEHLRRIVLGEAA